MSEQSFSASVSNAAWTTSSKPEAGKMPQRLSLGPLTLVLVDETTPGSFSVQLFPDDI